MVHRTNPWVDREVQGDAGSPETWRIHVLLLLAFIIVLLFFGLGFALHFLWIIAAIFLFLWLVGYAVGRGESAGRHRFYRW
jgi:Flp pilus assembly protein TadB